MKMKKVTIAILNEDEKFENIIGNKKAYIYDIYIQKIKNGKYKIIKNRIGEFIK